MSVVRNSPVLNRAKPLFDKHVPVRGFNDNTGVIIRVLEGKIIAHSTEKVIHFEVTDEKNKQCLYYRDICEGDYQAFRESKRLKTSFGEYAKILIELIEKTLCGSCPSSRVGDAPVHFFSRLSGNDENGYTFSIVEDNHFSDEITQMTIELIRGDDQAVKEYLASRLELSMNVAHDRAELIEQLKTEQSSSQTRLLALDEELQEHRINSASASKSQQAKYAAEINEIRQKHMEQLQTTRDTAAAKEESLRVELDQAKTKMAADATEAQETVRELKRQLQDLSNKQSELQGLYNIEIEAKKRVEDAFQTASTTAGVNQGKFTDMVAEKVKVDETVKLQLQRIEGLEALLSQEKNVSRSTSEAQHAVEARLADSQEHLLATRRDLTECREDLREREERIERLETRVAKLTEHIKRKDDILRRQEEGVEKAKSELNDTKQQLLQEQSVSRALQTRCDDLARQVQEAHTKISEATGQIANDQEVITYLNEQVHQLQLGGGIPSPAQPHHGTFHEDLHGASAYTAGPYKAISTPSGGAGRSAGSPALDMRYTPYDSAYLDYDYTGALNYSPDNLPNTDSKYPLSSTAAAAAAAGSSSSKAFVRPTTSAAQQGSGSKTAAYLRGEGNSSFAEVYSPTHYAADAFLSESTPYLSSSSSVGGGSRAAGSVTATALGDVDLDNLDYYQMASAASPPSRSTTRIPRASRS